MNDVGAIILPENLRTKLGEDAARELVVLINNTKADLEKEIANTKAELIKWMFIFWLGQIAVVVGVLAYLK